jgi:NAD(P)H-hydrate repair Nnr-like enzyme with NAD(P)H-hydrate epimerase domain
MAIGGGGDGGDGLLVGPMLEWWDKHVARRDARRSARRARKSQRRQPDPKAPPKDTSSHD